MTEVAVPEARIIAPQAGPQEAFCASPADVAIFGGAAGGGKTVGLLIEPLRHIRVPGFKAVFFRRTSKQITDAGGMWDESEELYAGLAKPVKGLLEWRFPTGARFEFSHMEHEKNRLDWKGAQVPYIGWDQLEGFTERQFWYLFSRNRSTCGVAPYMRATCNPVPRDDETGGWLNRLIAWWIDQDTGFPIPGRSGVIRYFVRDPETDELQWGASREELDRGYPSMPVTSLTFIPATLEDNPILDEGDPSYRGKLMALPRVERERLLGGNWNVRPGAGMYFQRSWFRVVRAAPAGGSVVRAWDLAGTRKTDSNEPAWTAGVRVRMLSEGDSKRFVVEDLERVREGPGGVKRTVRNTASRDGIDVVVRIPQDPGQAGKAQVKDYVGSMPKHVVRSKPVTGDKPTRAGPASAQAEAGNIDVVEAPWNDAFFRALERFPDKPNDVVDALADAIDELTEEPKKRVRWSSR